MNQPSPSLRWYRRQAALNTARGLTCKGTPRKRRANAVTAEERLRLRQERGLRAWGKLSLSRTLAGLTTRGGQRVYRISRGEVLILASEIDAVARASALHFAGLPPAVEAALLELAHHLAAIKRRL